MDDYFAQRVLNSEDKLLAGELWHSLMFAPSRIELEDARLELGKASLPIQWAVIDVIREQWVQEQELTRDENPFGM